MKTINEAQNFLKKHMDEGAECPCCSQFVKMYKRKLNSGMAHSLLRLVKLYHEDDRYYHVSEIGDRFDPSRPLSGDFAKLEHWGLIEQLPNTDDAKRTSGKWRPTKEGIRFVYNEITVPTYCYLFDGEDFGFSDERCTMIDALNNKFDYSELMGWR